MARVQQAAIDKARKVIGDMMSSPAFPSRGELLESSTTIYNVVTSIRANNQTTPEKTVCGLLVEALDLGNDITGEALWKRYRRVSDNRARSEANRATGFAKVSAENIGDNFNKDGSDVNRDTSERLFIPPGISQTDLAAGIATYFQSQGYASAALLRTCLMAMDGMTARMYESEIKEAVDAWYHPQDGRDVDADTAESRS